MTDVVQPSPGNSGAAQQIQRALQRAGGREGYIPPSSEPLLKDEAADIDPNDTLGAGADDEFAESHSASSFDVTVEGGEAVVEGALLATDEQRTVTVAASTNNQTIYLGYRRDTEDSVIVGLDGAFSGIETRRMPIYDVDADGSGVTAVEDRRNRGLAIGEGAVAEGTNSMAVGLNSSASGDSALALGRASSALFDHSVAVGQESISNAESEGVLGVDPSGFLSGPTDWRIPGTLTIETLLTVPQLSSDPSSPGDGTLWYNTTEHEYRGVENGTVVAFDTTPV